MRIRERSGLLGVTLASLCKEANAKTGDKLDATAFSKAIQGKLNRPCADRAVEAADEILTEVEKKIKEDKH